MYFSISAPQSVAIPSPGGPITLEFRVNPADSSLVEIHATGADKDGIDGTHILTFKRNGGAQDQTFVPTPAPETTVATNGPQADASSPTTSPASKKSYPSVDDDAVRADDWKPTVGKGKSQGDSKPAP